MSVHRHTGDFGREEGEGYGDDGAELPRWRDLGERHASQDASRSPNRCSRTPRTLVMRRSGILITVTRHGGSLMDVECATQTPQAKPSRTLPGT